MRAVRRAHGEAGDHVRAIVTGGAGFVGSHLCEALLAQGHEVMAIDDLSTGSRDNVAGLLDHPHFTLFVHDVTEPYFAPADRIYNLACPASPVHYQRDPVKTVVTNVVGTINGLRLAARTGARFLQASTSEIYGDPDVHPQTEDYCGNVNPIGPRGCYDEGKRCSETLCFDFHRQEGVEIRVARIFNTYGPRMAVDDGRVVSNFIVQALRGEPLTIYGEGQQTRSFCYVQNLVEGLMALMENPTETGPMNLGNPVEFTIRELAEEVLKITELDLPLVERELPADDPKQRRPDITRAQQALGFDPSIPLAEGLRYTVDYFRTRVNRS
ncbi:MAG: SDR family oxidoreductase [Sandaracinaceae bacterium]|nr:SDR family oxidoreductase [Sandaracinaceae bacterium]